VKSASPSGYICGGNPINDVTQKANGPQIVARKFKENSWRTWSALWSALKLVGLFVPLLSLPSSIFGTIQAAWAGTVTHTYDDLAISKQNMSYQEVLQLAKDMFQK